jgi:hypothetical protein
MMLEFKRLIPRQIEVTGSGGEVNDVLGEMSHKRPFLIRQESGLLQASNAPWLSLTTHLKIKVS